MLPPPAAPLPSIPSDYQKANSLLRDGKTVEARAELSRLQKSGNNSSELWYQMARSHLLDFYREENPVQKRLALSLAMEALSAR